MKILGIGDGVVDYYQDQGLYYPGGSVVNVAVFAKQNGAEQAGYMGILGTDQEGDHILYSLEKEKVNTERVRRVHGVTGEAVVTLDEEGDRVFVGTNKDKRVQSLVSLRLNQDDLSYIDQYDLVHATISINHGIEEELPKISSKMISFDFSTKEYWTEEYVKKVSPYLDFAFFSGSDLTVDEIHQLIQQVHKSGVKVVGVTRGAQPVIFSEEGMIFTQSPLEVEAVDTMGAGDSFIASFLMSYTQSEDMGAALRTASEFASKVCGHYGAFGYGAKK
ncbi:PfkB family carbohydrate kinase [Domibacillus indicus]|uniref:PfkB family carbohydrate kinase n=1 Tax=Domibacillus indicus TaxID=1437523 RepID=UPI00203E11E1|nr:PfkB family carbohydrate kinase [Domibacillus indicus]MCM3790298.1 PfkB family carbohydrate kinase [Domibacillus indicus]